MNLFLFILFSAKNYELPKLLIREGSPIESFHSSDTQLETLALRCDSPKSVLNTITTSPSNPLDIQSNRQSGENAVPVQLIEPATINERTELNTLIYDHANGLEVGFRDHVINKVNDTSLVSCNTSNNSSCEILHNPTSNPQMSQSNDFRAMFGSSPTLLNHNPIGAAAATATTNTTTRCLDTIPLKYRRGYSNLNDACLSSSTSNLECLHKNGKKTMKDILRTNRSAKECFRNAGKSSTNSNSISQEIFSFLHHQNNAPADYVRSYENLDRTKLVRMKHDRQQISMGNTNYGYADGDTVPHYQHRSQISSSSSSSTHSQDWRYGKSFDDEMKEEDDSTDDYSYSNLAYDNSTCGELSGNPSFWNSNQTYQSDDSLFNINFDAVDDDVFEIDTLNNLLDTTDLESPTKSDHSFFDDDNVTTANETKQISSAIGVRNEQILNGANDQLADISTKLLNHNEHLLTFDKTKLEHVKDEKFEIKPICIVKQPATVIKNPSKSLLGTATVIDDVPNASAESNSKKSVAEQNPRCAQCNKKLGIIMIMKCHCEKIFCAKHRYAEAHNCSFDFKGEGQKTIAKENPLVVANKVAEI